jgi:hypothetical protein
MNWYHYLVFTVSLLQVGPSVVDIREIERFIFMGNNLRNNSVLLIDARTPEWFNRVTIDISYTGLSQSGTPEVEGTLALFGGRLRGNASANFLTVEQLGSLGDGKKVEKWDYSNTRELELWCYAPECGQSPRAILGLLKTELPCRQDLLISEGHVVVGTNGCNVGRLADFNMNMSVT